MYLTDKTGVTVRVTSLLPSFRALTKAVLTPPYLPWAVMRCVPFIVTPGIGSTG